jgi:hypothetical protein
MAKKFPIMILGKIGVLREISPHGGDAVPTSALVS